MQSQAKAFPQVRREFAFFLCVLAGLAGCNDSAAVQPPPIPACSSSRQVALADDGNQDAGNQVGGAGGSATDGKKAVTFYGDLFPILSSNKRGEVYKCTTCHAHYAKPDGLNNVRELELVVDSMRSGRMPRTGNHVTPEKIELFVAWRLQGFQVGTEASAAATTPVGASAGPDSGSGCAP